MLGSYTQEVLRDIAAAKAAGGRALLHVTAGDRVSRQTLEHTAFRLRTYGYRAERAENSLVVGWGPGRSDIERAMNTGGDHRVATALN
jgi:hypothetical protein